MRVRVSFILVTFESADALLRTLPRLRDELEEGDEVIVWDNASSDETVTVVSGLLPAADVVACPQNRGFAAGANGGAARATGDLLVFLNPDAVPASGFGAAIRRPFAEEPRWGAWQGLVTMEGGARINTRGGRVHVSGLAWAGGLDEPAEDAGGRCEVGFASGACLAVRSGDWRALGGFPEDFFMYCEDVDLSLRLRLAGRGVGIEPAARVDHDYAFAKGAWKWRRLERNRWGVLVRTFPLRVLVAAAPALLAAEVAALAASLAGGWWREKLGACVDVARAWRRWRGERAAIQATRSVPVAEWAAALTPVLDSPALPAVVRSPPVTALSRAWWRLASRGL